MQVAAMPLGACAEEWAPGPTVSVSSAMGGSDPRDAGEVLMVVWRECTEKGVIERYT